MLLRSATLSSRHQRRSMRSTSTQLADGTVISFFEPGLLTFPNGVSVAFNNTPITDGVVACSRAGAPGGSTVLEDTAVAAAAVAAHCRREQRGGSFDPVAIEAFLADKEVVARRDDRCLHRGLERVRCDDRHGDTVPVDPPRDDRTARRSRGALSSTSTTNCRLPRIPRSIRTTRASSC